MKLHCVVAVIFAVATAVKGIAPIPEEEVDFPNANSEKQDIADAHNVQEGANFIDSVDSLVSLDDAHTLTLEKKEPTTKPISPVDDDIHLSYTRFMNTWLRVASVNLNRPDLLNFIAPIEMTPPPPPPASDTETMKNIPIVENSVSSYSFLDSDVAKDSTLEQNLRAPKVLNEKDVKLDENQANSLILNEINLEGNSNNTESISSYSFLTYDETNRSLSNMLTAPGALPKDTQTMGVNGTDNELSSYSNYSSTSGLKGLSPPDLHNSSYDSYITDKDGGIAMQPPSNAENLISSYSNYNSTGDLSDLTPPELNNSSYSSYSTDKDEGITMQAASDGKNLISSYSDYSLTGDLIPLTPPELITSHRFQKPSEELPLTEKSELVKDLNNPKLDSSYSSYNTDKDGGLDMKPPSKAKSLSGHRFQARNNNVGNGQFSYSIHHSPLSKSFIFSSFTG